MALNSGVIDLSSPSASVPEIRQMHSPLQVTLTLQYTLQLILPACESRNGI